MINAGFTDILPHALLAVLAILLVVAAVIDVRTLTISNRLNLTVALLAPSPAPVALLSLTVNVSLFSLALSFLIGTSIVFESWSPAAQLKVPVRAVKSFFVLAVPLAVSNLTVAAPLLPPVRVTVTVRAPTPSSAV